MGQNLLLQTPFIKFSKLTVAPELPNNTNFVKTAKAKNVARSGTPIGFPYIRQNRKIIQMEKTTFIFKDKFPSLLPFL